jgi:hypothetical protein
MSQKKSLFARILHELKLICSEEYRQQCQLQHGKELWEELDAKLPEMTYTEAADKVRLRMFNNLVTELSVEERADLATWLADAYHNLKVNFTENTTGKIEQVESHLLHKYEMHSIEMLKLKEGA